MSFLRYIADCPQANWHVRAAHVYGCHGLIQDGVWLPAHHISRPAPIQTTWTTNSFPGVRGHIHLALRLELLWATPISASSELLLIYLRLICYNVRHATPIRLLNGYFIYANKFLQHIYLLPFLYKTLCQLHDTLHHSLILRNIRSVRPETGANILAAVRRIGVSEFRIELGEVLVNSRK